MIRELNVLSSKYTSANIIALFRHASMSSSYKPALLLAIVRCVRAEKSSGDRIELADLAAQYLALYWTQVVVFRLRHSPRDAAQPLIVQLIRGAADRHGTRKLADLPSYARETLIREIESVLPINVLAAFHRSRPAGLPLLFTWKKKQANIELASGAKTYITESATELIVIATYFWARYLSSLNATPHIVEKLEPLRSNRSSLVKYSRVLMGFGECECFYCGVTLSASNISPSVDHFIPWTFVYEDRLWNLVLSCNRCNASKSDGLPTEELLERLIHLNNIRASLTLAKPASFIVTERAHSDLIHLYRMAQDEGWPHWRRVQGISS
jgi:5-methylcytosine-specific restriction endonuclease McrA